MRVHDNRILYYAFACAVHTQHRDTTSIPQPYLLTLVHPSKLIKREFSDLYEQLPVSLSIPSSAGASVAAVGTFSWAAAEASRVATYSDSPPPSAHIVTSALFPPKLVLKDKVSPFPPSCSDLHGLLFANRLLHV